MGEAGQERDQAFKGEADHVGSRAGDGFNEIDGVFLGGVGASLVQDMDAPEVVLDFPAVHGTETNMRYLDERGDGTGGTMLDAYAGKDLVGAATERGEHLAGIVEGRWLAKRTPIEGDQRIRRDDTGRRMQSGDGARFAPGVEQDGLADGEMRRKDFLDGQGDDIELIAMPREQLAPAGR